MVARILGISMTFALTMALLGCDEPKAELDGDGSDRYLYVATGACYSGNGLTAFTNLTATNKVYRLSLNSGQIDAVIADYYASPSNAGDSPVGLANFDDDHLLVLVENTTTATLRRIEKVRKTASGDRLTYSGNTTALSAQLRRMIRLNDGYLLISKSTAAEKHADGSNRLTVGANPWLNLNTPASACTTSTTLITDLVQLPSGLLAYSHAATGQARFGIVSALGYGAAIDCKAAQTSPAAASFPTAMVYDAANQKMLVAYGGASTANDLNTIYAYTVDGTTGAISSPQELYDANGFGSTYTYLLFGISSMAFDATTGKLYVASAISTAATVVNYRIRRFTYDPTQIGVNNASVLTDDGVFFNFSSDTKCISSLLLAP